MLTAHHLYAICYFDNMNISGFFT